jgi:hypothetical protein
MTQDMIRGPGSAWLPHPGQNQLTRGVAVACERLPHLEYRPPDPRAVDTPSLKQLIRALLCQGSHYGKQEPEFARDPRRLRKCQVTGSPDDLTTVERHSHELAR